MNDKTSIFMKSILIVPAVLFFVTGCASHTTANNTNNSVKTNSAANQGKNSNTSATKTPDKPVPVLEEYRFAPGVDPSKVSQSDKNQFQTLLNKLGDPPANTVTVNGFSAGYTKTGALQVWTFVRNGYNRTIDLTDLRLKVEIGKQIIADGDFKMTAQNIGSLQGQVSEPYLFTFNKNAVFDEHANFSQTYHIVADSTFN